MEQRFAAPVEDRLCPRSMVTTIMFRAKNRKAYAANIAGNHVIIDLGKGTFALYAHLKKGSVIPKRGEFVSRGQLLGIVGNSGNSGAPHLHFEIMAAPSSSR